MNIVKKKNIIYKYESYWRNSPNDTTKDSNGKLFPFPKQEEEWGGKDLFLHKLDVTEKFMRRKNNFEAYDRKNYKDCHICGQKAVSKGIFTMNKVRWEDGLFHYINSHNITPSEQFLTFIYRIKVPNVISKSGPIARINSNKYKKGDLEYVKIDKNQLLIFDALLEHGSYVRKYIDSKNNKVFRYSEHAGVIDFNDHILEKIIVSGNTTRVDKNDNTIFMPDEIIGAYDYEYIFHTHPATPTPGGRAKEDGILYEFPSISDLFHFLEHYNEGVTQGSLVLASEGLYNIRKLDLNGAKIRINEDDFYAKINRTFHDEHDRSTDKYGTTFSQNTFYSKIAQDRSFIKNINKTLNKFKMHIDYFPRIQQSKNNWIIDTLYLPVVSIEPKK